MSERQDGAAVSGPLAIDLYSEELLSRVAVGSLEEARDAVNAIIQHPAPPWSTEGLRFARECSASGGSVDLPDGTRIEVRATTWRQLATEAARADRISPASCLILIADAELGNEHAQQQILAAWNAEHGR